MKYSFLTQHSTNPKIQYYLHLAVITLLISIVYYPTIDAPFIFDDYPNIVFNEAVHPDKTGDLFDVFQSKYSKTRPLALLTFSLNYLFGGLDVFGYHLVNILIHIIVTFLVYNIFINFPIKTNLQSNESEKRYAIQNVSFWAASLWALNPIQTQAVTYIVQRMTSLAALFYLAAVYIFIYWRNNSISKQMAIPFIVSFFLLGMACKEIVITLPLTLLLIDYLFYSKKITRMHLIVMGFFFVGATGTSFFYLNGKLPDFFSQSPGRNFSPWERIMTEWRVLWHYLSLYLLPLPSRMHLAYDVTISNGFLTPWTTITSLLTIATSWLIAWKYRFRFPVLSFAWIFFFLALALESTFLPLEIAFAHRLYLPTVFMLFSLLATIPNNIFKRTTIFFILLLGLLSFWTIARNDEWNNAEKFWKYDLTRGANPARALNNQAAKLIETCQYQQAITILKEGLKDATGHNRMLILYNLGMSFSYVEEHEEAIKAFKQILEEFGVYEYTYLFIGQSLLSLNRAEEAKNIVVLLSRNKKIAYQGIILQANIFRNAGEYDKAEIILKNTINTTPLNKTEMHLKLRHELAIVYLAANKIKEAYDTYLEIIDLFPGNYFAWLQIHKMLISGNDIENADKIKLFLSSQGIKIE
jgi:tetratricopeptide (TPR) repeat protein